MTEEQSAEALRLLRSIADSLVKLANPPIQVSAAHSGLAVGKPRVTSFDFSPEADERERAKYGMATGSAMPKKPHD